MATELIKLEVKLAQPITQDMTRSDKEEMYTAAERVADIIIGMLNETNRRARWL